MQRDVIHSLMSLLERMGGETTFDQEQSIIKSAVNSFVYIYRMDPSYWHSDKLELFIDSYGHCDLKQSL